MRFKSTDNKLYFTAGTASTIKGGIKVPIYVVPLGVNTDLYNPNVVKKPITCFRMPYGNLTDNLKSFNFIILQCRNSPQAYLIQYV